MNEMNKPASGTAMFSFPDGRVVHVPVKSIAKHRVVHHRHQFNDNIVESLANDTLPLFSGINGRYWVENWVRKRFDADALVELSDGDTGATDGTDYTALLKNGDFDLSWIH